MYREQLKMDDEQFKELMQIMKEIKSDVCYWLIMIYATITIGIIFMAF